MLARQGGQEVFLTDLVGIMGRRVDDDWGVGRGMPCRILMLLRELPAHR